MLALSQVVSFALDVSERYPTKSAKKELSQGFHVIMSRDQPVNLAADLVSFFVRYNVDIRLLSYTDLIAY